VIVEGLPAKQSFAPATTVLEMTPVAARVKPRADAPMHLDASASFEKIDYAKTTAFRKDDVEEAAKQLAHEATHATNDNLQWKQFEKIGLKPKAAPSNIVGKLVVNVYRLLGFGILTVIVVVLVSYIATTAFYMVNKSWITPVAVSNNDEKVVATQTQLAAAQNQRDRVAAELADADRAILAQQAFQVEFAKSIQSDLEGRKAALNRTLQLAGQAGSMRHQIRTANEDYAKAHEDQMKKEYETGLIDRNSMLSGKFQIAQISTTNLSLAERQAQFETQAAELATQTRSLDALLAKRDKNSPALSYDVLKIKHDFDQSKLELAKSIEARDMLKGSLARQDQIIEELSSSGYLRAVRDKAIVALVPYSNLDKLSPGTTVYACRLEMVWCREVGSVLKVLPGEVQFKHPHRDKQVRGQMIELKMDDLGAAEDDVLFVDSKPLGF
jgi:hypothetical protein